MATDTGACAFHLSKFMDTNEVKQCSRRPRKTYFSAISELKSCLLQLFLASECRVVRELEQEEAATGLTVSQKCLDKEVLDRNGLWPAVF